MKTIAANLTAAQRVPRGKGIANAVLADGPVLHATQVVATTPAGSNTMACNCGAFYVRIRMTASGLDKLDVQKITDPTVGSQWTTWTNLVANNVAHVRGIAIFWTGTYVVVCWQDLASGDVKYKRSTDGVTWSGTATAYAATGNTKALSGCSASSTTSGIALTYASQLYWGQYNDAANTWTAVSSAGTTITTTVPDVAVFADTANSRYIFAIAAAGFKTWTTFAIALFTRSFAGAWDGGRVAFAQSSTGFTGLSFAQNQVRSRWWLSFYKITLWNVATYTTQLISSSNDGLYWSDPVPTTLAGNERTLDILSAASGWSNAYFSTERAAYRLDTHTYWAATVVKYEWAAAIAGSQASGGGDEARPQLRLVLDNRAGTLTAPRLFSELTLNRGYLDNGVSYTQSAGLWYVAGFRYLETDELLELQCFDARGLLAIWFAAEAASFRLDSVATLVERICALAGVHTVSFDGFAAWGDVISAFTHPVGENALYSLRSLAERVPFEYIVKEDGSLYFYVPTAGPASVYTYGSGPSEHKFWPGEFGAAPAINYLQVVGSPPRNRVTVAKDAASLDDTGRRRSLVVNDRRITTDANGTELSDALLVVVEESKRAGSFTSPPAFGLEPGDVIDFNNGLYADTAGPWRVERVEESFNDGGKRPFVQRISLRGTA
jgi:hypothetical protein